jgi:hypothetical protein
MFEITVQTMAIATASKSFTVMLHSKHSSCSRVFLKLLHNKKSHMFVKMYDKNSETYFDSQIHLLFQHQISVGGLVCLHLADSSNDLQH